MLAAAGAGALAAGVPAAWAQCPPTLFACPPSLAAPVAYFVGGSPQDVAMGDLNGDGRADVAVAVNDDFSPRVSVLLGNADGTLQAPVNAAVFGQFSGTRSVAIGRMNADAVLDLVVANLNGNSVAVLLGNGDGTFQAPTFTTVSSLPQSVAVGDVNADGFDDVVTANGSNNAGVLLGNGTGTLQAPVYYAVGTAPQDIAIGRWDADAIPDLVVTDRGGVTPGATVSVLRGNGNGTFQARVPVQVGSGVGPWGIAPMQFEVNGTSLPGFTVSLQAANRLLQVTGSSWSSFPGPLDPRGVAAADLNGDGRADAVASHTNPAGVSVYVGTPDGLSTTFTTFPTGQDLTQTVAVGDIDGDGWNDIATGDGNSGTVTVFLNTFASGAITQQPQAAAVPEGQSVTFSVVASGAVSYRWRRDCVELSDGGAYSGTATSTLTVSGVSAAEAGDYDVLVTPACSGIAVASRNAALLLTPAPACPADFNNDGVVNSTDVSDFINTWFKYEPTGCP